MTKAKTKPGSAARNAEWIADRQKLAEQETIIREQAEKIRTMTAEMQAAERDAQAAERDAKKRLDELLVERRAHAKNIEDANQLAAELRDMRRHVEILKTIALMIDPAKAVAAFASCGIEHRTIASRTGETW